MNLRNLTVLGFAFLLSASRVSLAQTAGSAMIQGTVKDPTGAVVPAATVLVHNKDTNVDREVHSNEAGIYVASFVPPGPYEITVTKTGFVKYVRQDLSLQVGQTMTVDIQMQVQAATDTVTVTGEAPIVDPEKTDVSQVVSTGFVSNLPIAGRRWETFVLLTPNATTDGGSGLISYRGISGLYNSTAVDGANNSQALMSETRGRVTGIPYIYSQDSIQEFQVSTANYSAELGQAAGGITNAVTRSGTNTFHGDLFYYLRYPSWNALDPLAKSQGIYTQTVHQQQQFGGSIGGPILKDKLFFFLTYDGSRKVNPILYTSTVKYPLTCNPLVPASLCTAANSFLQSQVGIQPRFANQDLGFGKLDYQLNSKNRISSSFNLLDFKSPNSYRGNPTYSNESVSYNGPNWTQERIFITNWDSTITSSTINNVRFQWGRDLEITGANFGPPAIGIAGSPGGASVMSYGMPNALPRAAEPDEHRIQIADILSKVWRTHTFKVGADINLIHEVMINLFQGGGIYAYQGSAQAAFNNWVADVAGVNLGDGLTGRHWTTFTQVTDPITHVGRDDFWMKEPAFFFEDTWRARPNLTLNLGLRYDLQLVPQPPQPFTATPLTTLYTSKINIDKNNFGPRFGLAWQIGKGAVLRSGYGMMYAQTPGSTYYAQRVENGVYQQQFVCGSPAACPSLTFPNVIFAPPGPAMQAPFPGALTPQVTTFAPPAGTNVVHGLVPDFVNPLVHEGDVTFEKQLPMNMSFTAAYVVSRALHLPIYVDANVGAPVGTRSYDVTNLAGVTQSTLTMPFYPAGDRINPGVGVILTGFSDVNSWYNSMVLTFRKRMSHGLEFLANYTLSKAIDGGQVGGQFGTFFGTDPPVDPLNRKLEYGNSDLDQRQRFVTSAVWYPAFGKISNKPTRVLLDGFNFSTITTIATGQPVTESISGFPSGGVDGGLTGGVVSNSGNPTGGRAPFLTRNNYYLPNIYNVDFRIAREIRFTERMRLSLVGEAFNLFNHTIITGIGPGSPPNSFNFTNAGAGACAGHSNACIVPNASFPSVTTTSTAIYGARQLQISGRFSF
ncbi:MAG: TonB-dependent receptor [Bryobacterales bacterium]|nr:TonB-dependent receptor [Bryobacterales bacterium]MBV9400988.1 TonB-dependent receptor [Bryobacterales bacterium]